MWHPAGEEQGKLTQPAERENSGPCTYCGNALESPGNVKHFSAESILGDFRWQPMVRNPLFQSAVGPELDLGEL